MKVNELKGMNEKDMKEKLDDLRKNLIKLNAQVSTGTTPKSPGEIRKIKRTIAQILTIKKSKTEVRDKG